jgi:hypothetical protein
VYHDDVGVSEGTALWRCVKPYLIPVEALFTGVIAALGWIYQTKKQLSCQNYH